MMPPLIPTTLYENSAAILPKLEHNTTPHIETEEVSIEDTTDGDDTED